MSDLRGQTDDGAELYTEDVSRAYRLAAREEPGPEVDAAIHAAAVRAAGSSSRFHRRRRGAWWGVPIAVAATIVIGVSVAFLASDRPDPVSQSNESQRSLSAPSAAPASIEVSAADAARQTPQPPVGETGGQAPVAAAAREARPTRERTTRDQAVPRREQYASRPPTPAAAGPEAADAAPAAPSTAAIEAPQPPAVPEAARSMRQTAPEVRPTEENEPLSPEVWLQRIRELRNKGEVVQADESLRAFRRRYPDYPLPADVPPPAQVGK